MSLLTVIELSDPAPLWAGLGFCVEGSVVLVGGIEIRLDVTAGGEGILAWDVDGMSIDGLTVAEERTKENYREDEHPNGVVGLDHIVLSTPDIERTIEAFEGSGIRLRRTRDVGTPRDPTMQAFFRLENTVVEVVGPPGRSQPGPASLYGLAFNVEDMEQAARVMGLRLRPPKRAVQEGRTIATLDRSAGSSVAIAFMSPRPQRPS